MQQVNHSLTDAVPSAPADKTAFDFALPMHVFEKADAPEGQKRRFGGICSTDSIDRQGERILQDGLDWGDFFEHGWFNDNHSQKTADVLGYGDKNSLVQFKAGDLLPNGAQATSNGTWVEGYLLNRPACDQIWDLAQSLQGTGRNLGFSVEGNIIRRTGVGNKTIAKAKIRNIALTNCPVNTDCKLEALARSLAAVEAQAQEEEAQKAMGGAGAPVPLANATGTSMTAGRIVAKEALEADLHNNAGGEILRRKGKKKKQSVKTLKRSEAIAYVQSRVPGLARKQAQEIVMSSEQISKAGEGSRGGHIIGHTKSGKPIYENGGLTESYGLWDHVDAVAYHRDAATQAVSKQSAEHEKHAETHFQAVRNEIGERPAQSHFAGGAQSLRTGSPASSAQASALIAKRYGSRDAPGTPHLAKLKSIKKSAAISYLQARVKGLSKADARLLLTHSRALHTAGLV